MQKMAIALAGWMLLIHGCGDSGSGGPVTFSVSGALEGLAGVLVLQLDGADDLMLTNDGPFSFPTELEDGAAFEVTILSKPGVQDCRIENGSGTIDGADAAISVTCDHFVFFDGCTPDEGCELWRTDGTEAGTVRVKDLNPDGGSFASEFLYVGNGTVVFSARDEDGVEPWITDGTEEGTFQLKDINTEGSSGPNNFAAYGGVVYFAADSVAEGRELWKTDGTTSGTVLVENIRPGAFSGDPSKVVELDGELYFSVADDDEGTDRKLRTTDGTTTSPVVNLIVGGSDQVGGVVSHNGLLYFPAQTPSSGVELFISDGTADGTMLLKDVGGEASGSSLDKFTSVGEDLFFVSSGGPSPGLWVTKGTPEDTLRIRPSGLSLPVELTAFDDALFFRFAEADSDYEPWRSDGTEDGTEELIDINDATPQVGSLPSGFLAVGDRLFFRAYDEDHGRELWATDGTAEGTALVRDIEPGPTESGPITTGQHFGRYIFFATTAETGFEPWVSDGTEEGTTMIKDICPGACSSFDN